MRLSAILVFCCVPIQILISPLPALAGQLPTCIKSSSSRNGNFLALMNTQLDPPQASEGVARKIRGFSFEIFPKENFINAGDRLTAPGTYFSDWAQWGVALDSRNATDRPFTSFCPLPLVTDDGEFLILLAHTPDASIDWVVLRIYRWDRMSKATPSQGRLVAEIPLKKFYIPLLESPCCTDESPMWFAGGSFDFSPDDRQLTYVSQYGNAVRINLSDGSVSSK